MKKLIKSGCLTWKALVQSLKSFLKPLVPILTGFHSAGVHKEICQKVNPRCFRKPYNMGISGFFPDFFYLAAF